MAFSTALNKPALPKHIQVSIESKTFIGNCVIKVFVLVIIPRVNVCTFYNPLFILGNALIFYAILESPGAKYNCSKQIFSAALVQML